MWLCMLVQSWKAKKYILNSTGKLFFLLFLLLYAVVYYLLFSMFFGRLWKQFLIWSNKMVIHLMLSLLCKQWGKYYLHNIWLYPLLIFCFYGVADNSTVLLFYNSPQCLNLMLLRLVKMMHKMQSSLQFFFFKKFILNLCHQTLTNCLRNKHVATWSIHYYILGWYLVGFNLLLYKLAAAWHYFVVHFCALFYY